MGQGKEYQPCVAPGWRGPRTASSSSEERAALTGLSSAPRLAGDGVGAVNICKSLAVALLLCCLARLGLARWPEGLALSGPGASSFPYGLLAGALELPARQAQRPREAVQEDRVGRGASVVQPLWLAPAPSGLACGGC